MLVASFAIAGSAYSNLLSAIAYTAVPRNRLPSVTAQLKIPSPALIMLSLPGRFSNLSINGSGVEYAVVSECKSRHVFAVLPISSFSPIGFCRFWALNKFSKLS